MKPHYLTREEIAQLFNQAADLLEKYGRRTEQNPDLGLFSSDAWVLAYVGWVGKQYSRDIVQGVRRFTSRLATKNGREYNDAFHGSQILPLLQAEYENLRSALRFYELTVPRNDAKPKTLRQLAQKVLGS